jgi:hypothetical protein
VRLEQIGRVPRGALHFGHDVVQEPEGGLFQQRLRELRRAGGRRSADADTYARDAVNATLVDGCRRFWDDEAFQTRGAGLERTLGLCTSGEEP